AMSAKYLGESFDLHTGGVDNIFPHHENEIAQSEAFTGRKFVNYWLHCHHLIVDGEKMAKSKGNYFTLRDLLQRGINPLAIRFLLLSTHYRKQLNFTFEALDQAAAALERINEFAGGVMSGRFPEGETEAVSRFLSQAEKRFREGLGDDLNISVALTALFNLIKKVNVLISQGKVKKRDAEKLSAFMDTLDSVLAVITPTTKSYGKDVVDEGEILEKIKAREKARAEKNFPLADQIRQELAAEGIILEDTKEGVRWKIVPARRREE
ncbi:MAG: DALR domain-containing protein, partial [Acidobacteriota bacterium]